jgi:hypothetical protein
VSGSSPTLRDVHQAVAVLLLGGLEIQGDGEFLLGLLAEAGAGRCSAGLARQSCGFSGSLEITWKSRSPAERDGRCATNRRGRHEACSEKNAGLKASATSLEQEPQLQKAGAALQIKRAGARRAPRKMLA